MREKARELGFSYDINTVAAFTGHRTSAILGSSYDLKSGIVRAVMNEYAFGKRVFMSGMAQGFDLAAASAVLSLKNELFGIKLVCVFPCRSRDRLALEIAKLADGVLLLNEEYLPGCMLMRDRFLIENSSVLIAGYDGRREGGTYHTLALAAEKGRRIVFPL